MEQNSERHTWNIDFKSMVIGFLLAVCLGLILGASGETGDEGVGPYRCTAGSDTSVFVIDSRTGQTWRLSRTDNVDYGTPFDRKSLRKSITPMVN